MSQSPDQLVQVVFRSQPAEHLDDSRVQTLASEWSARHLDLNLSGLLIRFQTTMFVGVIEGPCAAAMARLETISSDSALDGLVVLREARISRRRFDTWRFQDLRTADGDAVLRLIGGLFAQKLSRELHKTT